MGEPRACSTSSNRMSSSSGRLVSSDSSDQSGMGDNDNCNESSFGAEASEKETVCGRLGEGTESSCNCMER